MHPSRLIALLLLTLGYAMALCHGALRQDALGVLLLLAFLGLAVRHPRLKGLGHCLFLLLAVALGAHLLPGFDNALVIDRQIMSDHTPPFSMALNLDKPLIGFWLLLACPWTVTRVGWRTTLKAAMAGFALTSAAVFSLALALGAVAWQPKWPPNAELWLLNNLLLVCIVEELLFRGYLQQGLQHALQRFRHGAALALLAVALLFGLSHLSGGWAWALLASLAGIGYGLAYRRGGLWAAVACHVGLNLVHFALFSYPLRLTV